MGMGDGKKASVDKRMFDCIKMLLENGASYEECATFMKVGLSTVGRIKAAETFEEYRQQMNVAALKYRQNKKAKLEEKASSEAVVVEEKPKEPQPQVVEHRQSVTIQATHYMEMELKKHTELLTLISNKLAYIVEELAGPVEGEAKEE